MNREVVVISMSLGRPWKAGDPDPAYVRAGQAALSRGALIIAAAGNNSHRPGSIAPVGSPANAPTILAVAAVDIGLHVAPFSCGGPQLALAGPGVNVFSSVPVARGMYGTMSGTSMATPHVSGIAALYAQQSPANRGLQLWHALLQHPKALPPQPRTDVGAGLVQA